MTVPMSIPPILSSSSLGVIIIASCTGVNSGPAITPINIAKKARLSGVGQADCIATSGYSLHMGVSPSYHQIPMRQTNSWPPRLSVTASSYPMSTSIWQDEPRHKGDK